MAAFADAVGDAGDDGCAGLEAADNLDGWAVVAADADRDKMHLVAVDDGGNGSLVVADDDGVAGDGERRFAAHLLERDDRVHAGEQAAVAVVDIDFGEHGAGVSGRAIVRCARRYR